jgi:predicted ATP-grasp superfamily ATP-dependent carboligase
VDLSGKWSVKFNDSAGKSLDLILLSAGSDRTMGTGTLVENGTKIPVTASGTVADQIVTLTTKTVVGKYVNQIDREYDLNLFIANNALSGTYVLKSGGKFLGKGNATAVKQ